MVDQARIKLNEVKLEMKKDLTYVYSAQYLRGQIVSHTPGPGEQVVEGTAVMVNISNGPGPSARDATVYVREIPNDGRPHVVKITVTDVRGTNDAYIKTHNPGDQVAETVRYWGRATIKVYVDDKLIKEQVLD